MMRIYGHDEANCNDIPAARTRLLTEVFIVNSGGLAGKAGMYTLSVDAGTPAGDQLLALFQSVGAPLAPPIHVFVVL